MFLKLLCYSRIKSQKIGNFVIEIFSQNKHMFIKQGFSIRQLQSDSDESSGIIVKAKSLQ